MSPISHAISGLEIGNFAAAMVVSATNVKEEKDPSLVNRLLGM
ncbi:hypothetical protein [Rickettsia endosymbiont of Polydrusus tereticollis]